MKLDARLVVQVEPEGPGAGVETTSNYVLTKTVEAKDGAGWSRGRSHEVVSFSAGERGEFSKGTVCQPNGALERIVLDVLPRIASAQSAEAGEPGLRMQPADSSRPVASMQITESSEPESSMRITEGAAPDPVMRTAQAGTPLPGAPTGESGRPAAPGQAPSARSEVPDAAVAAVPDARVAELRTPELSGAEDGAAPPECPIADKIFCAVLEVTDPYRRANQERNLGLAVDAIEGGSPLLSGSDVGFDVSLPSYDAYLTVSLFLKDGTVHHVLSGWDRRWPANAREFVSDAGLSIEDASSIEMVVALASDVLVFPAPRPSAETAELYLSDLRQRLSEIRNGGAPAQIAASLLVVTPA
jgi:hypothetical protein